MVEISPDECVVLLKKLEYMFIRNAKLEIANKPVSDYNPNTVLYVKLLEGAKKVVDNTK